MNYGKSIRELRTNKMNQSQVVFSEAIGITQSYLSQVESGKKKPSTDLIEAISKYCNVPVAAMMLLSVTINDVPKHKQDIFRTLNPYITDLIKSLYTN